MYYLHMKNILIKNKLSETLFNRGLVYSNGLPLETKKCHKLDLELNIYNQKMNKRRVRIKHGFGSLNIFKNPC
jgi:orotate phosphoribosyltransferase-like protein